MMDLSKNFDYVPVDAVFPTSAGFAYGSFCVFLSVIFLAVAVVQARKYSTFMPVLLVIAGFCNSIFEPFDCFVGHCWHPAVGQSTAFTVLGISVPAYLPFTYCAYFGAFYLTGFPKFLANTITRSFVYKAYFWGVVLGWIAEIWVVHNNLWIYYGQQPLWIWKGTMPVWWSFQNSMSFLGAFTTVMLALPYLKGWKQILVIPTSMIGIFIGWFSSAFPVILALNTKVEVSQLTVDLAGVASILLSLLAVWFCANFLTAQQSSVSR